RSAEIRSPGAPQWVGTLDGEPSHASVRLRLFGVRFRAGQVLSQESDLSGVMRLMLTDMEPLAKIVGWTPRPIFVDGHKPGVVALAEFRQRFCTGLPEDVQVVVSIVALDGFPARVPQIHRRIPLLLHGI